MTRSIEEVARAFSGHDFRATYAHLADHVAWTIVGDEDVTGRSDVIAKCDETASYLAEVKTEFRRFRTLVGEDWVVIDSLAEYTDREAKSSSVASCDIYAFTDGMLSEITSYNIALNET